MARHTPSVKDDRLVYVLDGVVQMLRVDSDEWQDWLSNGDGAFRFAWKSCVFTARREQRHGKTYWYAYWSLNKKRYKPYLGPAQDVTLARLREVADDLIARSKAPNETLLQAGYERLFSSERETETTQGAEDARISASSPLKKLLTAREYAIMKAIIAGLSNKQIARQQSLSESSVKKYISILYSKLDVQSRSQAIAKALYLVISS